MEMENRKPESVENVPGKQYLQVFELLAPEMHEWTSKSSRNLVNCDISDQDVPQTSTVNHKPVRRYSQ